MQETPIIRTTSLSYHYSRGQQTLFDINLEVPKGAIYGFLGPNGSGKTTTLSLLLGLLPTQKGTIEIFGEHLQTNRIKILKKTGSLIEVPSIYGHLSAHENLEVYRTVYGVSKERITEVLRIVGLDAVGKKKAKRFSLGMKQRLAIALALLPAPELLILDEPSNGLDPAGIVELRQLIRKLNTDHGMTILISSHLLGEVEKMVSHIGIIYKGKMLFQGSLAALQSYQQRAAKVLIRSSDNIAAMQVLASWQPELVENMISIPVTDQAEIAQVNRVLINEGIDVYHLQPREYDLEQLFIDLTTDAS